MGDSFDEGCERVSVALRSLNRRLLHVLEGPVPACLRAPTRSHQRLTDDVVAHGQGMFGCCCYQQSGSDDGEDGPSRFAQERTARKTGRLTTCKNNAAHISSHSAQGSSHDLLDRGRVQCSPPWLSHKAGVAAVARPKSGSQALLTSPADVKVADEGTPVRRRISVAKGRVGRCSSQQRAVCSTSRVQGVYGAAAGVDVQSSSSRKDTGLTKNVYNTMMSEGAKILNRELSGREFRRDKSQCQSPMPGLHTPLMRGCRGSPPIPSAHVDPRAVSARARRGSSDLRFVGRAALGSNEPTGYSPWSHGVLDECDQTQAGERGGVPDASERHRAQRRKGDEREGVRGSKGVVARCQKWKAQREERLKKMRLSQEVERLKDCTFKPVRVASGASPLRVPKVHSGKFASFNSNACVCDDWGTPHRARPDGASTGRVSPPQRRHYPARDRIGVLSPSVASDGGGGGGGGVRGPYAPSSRSCQRHYDSSVFERMYNRVCSAWDIGNDGDADVSPNASVRC